MPNSTLAYLEDAERRGATGSITSPIECRCAFCLDIIGDGAAFRGFRPSGTSWRWPWRRLEVTSG